MSHSKGRLASLLEFKAHGLDGMSESPEANSSLEKGGQEANAMVKRKVNQGDWDCPECGFRVWGTREDHQGLEDSMF